MPFLNKFFITSLVLMLFTNFGYCQKTELTDSMQTKVKSAARDIMLKSPNCALITIDEGGIPRVRMMDPFAPEEDFTVWFGTNPKSRKVTQIKQHPEVTLYYTENEGPGYVALHGKAQLVNDTMEKEKRWKEAWKAFYPNRTDGYLLVKVTPIWMEVVSYQHGLVSETPTWEPPRVVFVPE